MGRAGLARGILATIIRERSETVATHLPTQQNGKVSQSFSHHQRGNGRAYPRVPGLSFFQCSSQRIWPLDWEGAIPYQSPLLGPYLSGAILRLILPRALRGPLALSVPFPLSKMIAFLFALAWKVFLPALLVVALVDVLTQSQPQRIRRLHRTGLSQRSIASRLGVSRYQVKLALA